MDGKSEKKEKKTKEEKKEEKEKQTKKRKGKKNMIKKIISIFIYIVLTGCDTQNFLMGPEEPQYYLDISAPSLNKISDEYYVMTFSGNESVKYTTLAAQTGSVNVVQLLTWESDKEFSVEHNGQEFWENLVNPSSYTDTYGEGHTVLGVWPEFIGDTITVYCGFEDDNGNYYEDILKVIVE